MQVPIDRYIEVDKVKTRYWQLGESGNNIILLHGGGASIEFWVYNVHALAQNHRVYAFDMMGTGKSSSHPTADYTIASQAEFLSQFIATFNLEKTTLIGISMGGGVALQFTLKYPQLVEKLVLIDPMGFGAEISLGVRLSSLPGVVESVNPGRWMLPSILRTNFHNVRLISPEWIDLRYAVFAIPHRHPDVRKLVNANFNIWGVKPQVYRPIFDNLDRIDRPTLIFWGEFDRIIPVQHAQIAAQKIPQAQVHIFEDCGHHPYLEYPDRFDRLVLEFL
jgi:pimeloyl-ACP methyl ester carboxylesterase